MHFVDFCSMPTKEYNYTKSDKPSKMISEHMRNSFFAKKNYLGTQFAHKESLKLQQII
jgi:hypothetical protein